MQPIKTYCAQNSVRLLMALAVVAGLLFGVIDPGTALAAGFIGDIAPQNIKELDAAMKKALEAMQARVAKAEEVTGKALEEVKQLGTIHGTTNEELKKLGTELKPLSDALGEIKNRIQEIEQKGVKGGGGGAEQKSAGELFVESAEFKEMIEHRRYDSKPVKVGGIRTECKITIVNATGQNQPLVPSDRMPGIVFAPEQRLTIRDLIPVIRTSLNSIEWVKELVFTNNAGPQYDATSPVPYQEGAVKPESGITFQLNSTAVTTLAHWIPASRQILSDAPMLRDYIDMRLRYGLKLEEEDELLNGDGTNGTLNGLKNQATAFTGGVTNSSAIDTLLRAITQVRLAFYEPNGIVLHPTNWMDILLLKDTTGRYLFGDPHSATAPSIWAKPVVATVSQTLGEFTVGAFDRAAQIVDREDATVRISEHHMDFFTRNLVAILCEERLALLVTRPAAIIDGAMSHAG